MDLRKVELPKGISGKLYLTKMIGRNSDFQSDVEGILSNGISCVVRLTPDDEVERKSKYYHEAIIGKKLKWEELCFPIPDFSAPTDVYAFSTFVNKVVIKLKAGESIIAHCGAGIGRTSILAVSVLIKMGYTYGEAVKVVGNAGSHLETEEQEDFVLKLSSL